MHVNLSSVKNHTISRLILKLELLKILSLICKRLPDDWQARYQYKPVLLETFIESQKFRGTCYKAANWVYLGQTKGRGRNDQVNQKPHLPIKDILIYPLTSSFRKTLCNCKDE